MCKYWIQSGRKCKWNQDMQIRVVGDTTFMSEFSFAVDNIQYIVCDWELHVCYEKHYYQYK